jgi:hypothetical protein
VLSDRKVSNDQLDVITNWHESGMVTLADESRRCRSQADTPPLSPDPPICCA